MTDRELLELAAKAAGVAVHHWSHVDCPDCPDAVPVLTDGINTEIVVWNPLADDGDALRLAVSQRLKIDHNHPEDQNLWVAVRDRRFVACSIERFDDESQRSAATRRAIVRAAAEIGRAMK